MRIHLVAPANRETSSVLKRVSKAQSHTALAGENPPTGKKETDVAHCLRLNSLFQSVGRIYWLPPLTTFIDCHCRQPMDGCKCMGCRKRHLCCTVMAAHHMCPAAV